MSKELIEITDFQDAALSPYARYTENELRHLYEPQEGLFIAESPLVVSRAIDAGYEPCSMLVEHAQLTGDAKELIARCTEIPVYTANLAVLNELTGFPMTRGVLCAMRRRKMPEIANLVRDARRIVILEEVVNPTNVGAIFRSAAALNVDAVLLTKGCSDPLYRRASRVSMGTVFQIPWTYIERSRKTALWPDQTISSLKELGFTIAAMTFTEDAIAVDDSRVKDAEKLAIIMGTEGPGLSDEAAGLADYRVMIPMTHGVDSLNVASASAVAFWAMCR